MGKYAAKKQKQRSKKWLVVTLSVILVILAAAVGAGVWAAASYHIVDAKFYPKDSQVVDLRGQDINPSHYDKLAEKMTDSRILWDIPFQGGTLASDAKEVTVTTLSAKDIEMLDYAQSLTTVNAENCTDYENLAQLRQRRPELEINYSISFSCGSFNWDVESLVMSSVQEADIQLLKHLPNLKSVVLSGGFYETKTVEALRGTVHNAGLEFGVVIGGKVISDTEQTIHLTDATDEDLDMLKVLGNLTTVHLQNPKANPQHVFAMREELPNAAVTWDVTLGDKTYDVSVSAVDLTTVAVTDLAEVEQKMAYLPNLESVTFGLCGVDNSDWGNSKSKLTASAIKNEDMAAYRDRVRDSYKVVWTVRLGPSIALRTDADNFMPNHFGVGQLPDSYAYNLRYCEEMVCLDVGHMTLTDISFVEFMPNLKYLILAWTEVQYIEPIRTCKNLVFLELDNSCIRDISPLVDCTALEDLNLGNTFCDVTPILGMTWLKNVYFIDASPSAAYKFSQAVPDAHVVATGNATVGGGWRRLQNYYDMRDCLNMPYMN